MVHALTISPSPLFQIRLEDDTLTLRGTSSESVGCVLRGQLVLAITEPTKFREIKMTLQGRSKLGWLEGSGAGQYFRSEERIIFQHDWVFLPGKKNYHVLKPDNYRWNFELVLPGNLPETVEGCEHGNISYRLKAVAERPKLAINLNTQRKVTIQRCFSSTEELEYMQSTIVSNTWTEKVQYEFTTDSKSVCLGDKIPIHMILMPLQQKLSIARFSCKLVEHITYQLGGQTKSELRTICQYLQEKIPFEKDFEHTFDLIVPRTVPACHYDSQNDLIKISHKLKFSVVFNDVASDRKNYLELQAALPIIITPVSSNSDLMSLPAYREHYLDQLYLEDSVPSLSSSPSTSQLTSPLLLPLSYSSSSSASSSFSDSYLANLNSSELNSLPSYRSITSCIPAPLADSLPPVYNDFVI